MSAGPVAGRDRIELRGLRASGLCGVLPEEQVRPQPLEVDLDIEADLAPAGAADDLELTVDYGAVSDEVVRVVTTGRFALLEALADRIAASVLDHEMVTGVTVSVRKLRPPVAHQLATSGVRIHRERSWHVPS